MTFDSIDKLSNDYLINFFRDLDNQFKKAINAGNDDLADELDTLSFIIETELLSRDIDLKLIYGV